MKLFLITLGLALVILFICALFLGIGRVLKSKKPFSCKRCGRPEEKCKVCDNKKKPGN